jgi:hypothetical protein
VKQNDSREKSDAVAIKIKHRDTKDIIVYYFAYRITLKNTIEHIGNWKQIEQ